MKLFNYFCLQICLVNLSYNFYGYENGSIGLVYANSHIAFRHLRSCIAFLHPIAFSLENL